MLLRLKELYGVNAAIPFIVLCDFYASKQINGKYIHVYTVEQNTDYNALLCVHATFYRSTHEYAVHC